jgi:hypothetical protein
VCRKIKARFDGETGGDERLAGATLYWYIPAGNTMLTVDDADLNSFTKLDNTSPFYQVGYDGYSKTVSNIIVIDSKGETTAKVDTVNPDEIYFPYHIK